MTAFHFKAFKISEDKLTVTYNLNTDFFLDPSDFNPLCILNNADFNIIDISIKDKLVYILYRC